MSGSTLGRVPGRTDDLERASGNSSRWRTGRRLLVAEGVIVGAFGGIGLAWAMANAGTTPSAGVALLGLNISALQAVTLLGFGVLAVIASVWRRTGVIFTGLAAVTWLVFMILCTVAAAHRAPGAMGFDLRDSLIYAALAAYNLGLFMWLSADALEGPAWMRRPHRDDRAATLARRLH
jgi:hypothetical protein